MGSEMCIRDRIMHVDCKPTSPQPPPKPDSSLKQKPLHLYKDCHMGEQQQMFDFAESLGNKLMKTNQINVVDTWINAKKLTKLKEIELKYNPKNIN